MNVLYKLAFRKFVKKQTRPFQLVIEDETEKILKDPEIGESKKGDLAGFRVHKFVFQKQKYLIAYKM
ncbi:MAG: type II toxin-antitoxin system RelE/ParE family toxin, partial [Nitrospirota bacterium]